MAITAAQASADRRSLATQNAKSTTRIAKGRDIYSRVLYGARTASTVKERNIAGKNTMYGFTCQSARPSAVILPHEGIVGGVPASMNERIASTIMALAHTIGGM